MPATSIVRIDGSFQKDTLSIEAKEVLDKVKVFQKAPIGTRFHVYKFVREIGLLRVELANSSKDMLTGYSCKMSFALKREIGSDDKSDVEAEMDELIWAPYSDEDLAAVDDSLVGDVDDLGQALNTLIDDLVDLLWPASLEVEKWKAP